MSQQAVVRRRVGFSVTAMPNIYRPGGANEQQQNVREAIADNLKVMTAQELHDTLDREDLEAVSVGTTFCGDMRDTFQSD